MSISLAKPKYMPDRGRRASSASQAQASGVIITSQNHIAHILSWIMEIPIQLPLLTIRLYGDTVPLILGVHLGNVSTRYSSHPHFCPEDD